MDEQTTKFYDKTLMIILIVVASLHIYLFSQLEHVPSPIYGGDLYRERGFVQYILNGNNYWTDPYFKGELEFYPPLGYIIAAIVVLITGLSVDTVISFSPIIITPLIVYAFYTLGSIILKRKSAAFVMALTALAYNFFPVKHTYGLGIFFALLFLREFFRLEQESILKTKIKGGIFLGLAALSHYQPFLFTLGMTGTSIILEYLLRIRKERKIFTLAKELIKKYFTMFFIAFVISLIFFGPLIAKYQMKTPNRTQEYSQFDVNRHGIEWVAGTLWNQFIQTNNIPSFFTGILGLLGLLLCMMNKDKTEQRYSIFLLIGITLTAGHYLITKPIFNAWIVPSHMMAGLFIPFIILVGWGTRFITAITQNKTRHAEIIITSLIAFFMILPMITAQVDNYNNDRWTQYGRQIDGSTGALYQMAEWILENTNNDDVFLANDESAFAINALTGRQVVAVRRTHASPYADVDKRYADAIVMLYGNNNKTIQQLLKQYSVSYVMFDQFLLTSPMITNTEHKQYLEENGVKFSIQNVRLDPAGPDTAVYESIVVPPQELTITNLVQPAAQFTAGGQPIVVLYKTK